MKRGAGTDLSGKKAESASGKSELTVLAEKFKQQYCTQADIGKDVNLNDVADSLQVSRRRLYDIVNVLESLQMVSRGGKLTYRWEGIAHLPRLLALLYADVLSGAEHNQANPPAILEGRMPGSCWALTRRIVQQLLVDRNEISLTVLVQRLETALAATLSDTAGSSAGKTSLATVERRIYDIGSVLSTFELVAKTMQGGSGPRHRQPVYQWLYDWESQLPDTTVHQAAAAAAVGTAGTAAVPVTSAPAAAAAAAGAASTSMGHDSLLQQWYGYQPGGDLALQQQQQLMLEAGTLEHMYPGFSHYHSNMQQQQQHSDPAVAAAAFAPHVQPQQAAVQDDAAAAGVAALQLRLQQLGQLVNTVLAQHGEKTCVTLSQLKGLLQLVQADGPLQEQAVALGAASQQHQQEEQQEQQHCCGRDDRSQDTVQSNDQDDLDAAACLQQLKAGGAVLQQQQQQQQGVDGSGMGDDQPVRKRQRCCADPSPDCVPQSNDQCCPGMTCFDLGAALRAAAAAGGAVAAGGHALGRAQPTVAEKHQQLSHNGQHLEQQQQLLSDTQDRAHYAGSPATIAQHLQQQHDCKHTAAAAAAAAVGDALMADADADPDRCSSDCELGTGLPSNDQIDHSDPQDFAAFIADETDEPPTGARVGSNTLNNSGEGVGIQELAAAAVASLQQEQQQQQQDGQFKQGQEQQRCCSRDPDGMRELAPVAAAAVAELSQQQRQQGQQQGSSMQQLANLQREYQQTQQHEQGQQQQYSSDGEANSMQELAAVAAVAVAELQRQQLLQQEQRTEPQQKLPQAADDRQRQMSAAAVVTLRKGQQYPHSREQQQYCSIEGNSMQGLAAAAVAESVAELQQRGRQGQHNGQTGEAGSMQQLAEAAVQLQQVHASMQQQQHIHETNSASTATEATANTLLSQQQQEVHPGALPVTDQQPAVPPFASQAEHKLGKQHGKHVLEPLLQLVEHLQPQQTAQVLLQLMELSGTATSMQGSVQQQQQQQHDASQDTQQQQRRVGLTSGHCDLASLLHFVESRQQDQQRGCGLQQQRQQEQQFVSLVHAQQQQQLAGLLAGNRHSLAATSAQSQGADVADSDGLWLQNFLSQPSVAGPVAAAVHHLTAADTRHQDQQQQVLAASVFDSLPADMLSQMLQGQYRQQDS